MGRQWTFLAQTSYDFSVREPQALPELRAAARRTYFRDGNPLWVPCDRCAVPEWVTCDRGDRAACAFFHACRWAALSDAIRIADCQVRAEQDYLVSIGVSSSDAAIRMTRSAQPGAAPGWEPWPIASAPCPLCDMGRRRPCAAMVVDGAWLPRGAFHGARWMRALSSAAALGMHEWPHMVLFGARRIVGVSI